METNVLLVLLALIVIVVIVIVTLIYRREQRKMIILVWNKFQKVPATMYGKAHFSDRGFKIKVCKNPSLELRKLGVGKAIIYRFS